MISKINDTQAGTRLDTLVAEIADISRSAAAKLIESGDVLVNGTPVSKKHLPKVGDELEITLPEAEEYEAVAEDIPLDIIYEDDDLVVINKPSGMVVHPAPGNYTGTLVNALLFHCKDSLSGIGGVMRPGSGHRIDKDTAGLLVVAKNDFTHRALGEQLESHGVVREYHALVRGGFKCDTGTVSTYIGRHPVDRKKMAVLPPTASGAKDAVTHFEVAERFENISYLRLWLETGRTHQIRVHMAHLGHALLGDEVYSSSKLKFEKDHPALFDGQMLHAKKLRFIHPRTGKEVELESPLPNNFTRALELLRPKD